jgi:hypothetical protein
MTARCVANDPKFPSEQTPNERRAKWQRTHLEVERIARVVTAK